MYKCKEVQLNKKRCVYVYREIFQQQNVQGL